MSGTNTNHSDGKDKTVTVKSSDINSISFSNPSVTVTTPNAGQGVVANSTTKSAQGTINGVIFSNPA